MLFWVCWRYVAFGCSVYDCRWKAFKVVFGCDIDIYHKVKCNIFSVYHMLWLWSFDAEHDIEFREKESTWYPRYCHITLTHFTSNFSFISFWGTMHYWMITDIVFVCILTIFVDFYGKREHYEASFISLLWISSCNCQVHGALFRRCVFLYCLF